MMKKKMILLIYIFIAFACNKSGSGNTNPPPPPPVSIAKGADISWLTEMEATGKKFYNASGTEQDCIQILKNLGMNAIRLRVWVNPATGWNNSADVVVK